MSFGASFKPNSFKISLLSLLMFVLFGSVIVNVFLNKNIDLLLIVPVAPIGPVTPVASIGPVTPVASIGPVAPIGPLVPDTPIGPLVPDTPIGLDTPIGPLVPDTPVASVALVASVAPIGPVVPGLGFTVYVAALEYEFSSNPYFSCNSAFFSVVSNCNFFLISSFIFERFL